MKKTVKSITELNRQALTDGATVTNKSGRRFNASGKKSVPAKRIAPKKKIEKPDPSAVITDAVERQTSELKAILESLVMQMAEIKSNYPGPITAWDFKIIRENDRISDIQARVPARVLN